MKPIRILGMIIVIAICVALSSKADPARIINYQGRLVDERGVPFADGEYDMTFKIYSNRSGGYPIWAEEHTGLNKVTLTDGLFSVILGAITRLTLYITCANDAYIEVTVEGASYGRQRMMSSSCTIDRDYLSLCSRSLSLSNNTINTFVHSINNFAPDTPITSMARASNPDDNSTKPKCDFFCGVSRFLLSYQSSK